MSKMPNVRQTSVWAYMAIRSNGLLSRKRWQVYSYIFYHGPTHGPEIGEHVTGGWKRVSELIDLGVVEEVGLTTNKKTNMTVYEVDVTKSLPFGKIRTRSSSKKGEKALLKDINLLLKCGGPMERALIKEVKELWKATKDESLSPDELAYVWAKKDFYQHHLDNWLAAIATVV